MLTSFLYVQNVSEQPDAMIMQERVVCVQYTLKDGKESLMFHLSDKQKLWRNSMH